MKMLLKINKPDSYGKIITFFNKVFRQEKMKITLMSIQFNPSVSHRDDNDCAIAFYFSQKITQATLLKLTKGQIINNHAYYSCQIYDNMISFSLMYPLSLTNEVKKYILDTRKFVSFFRILLENNIITQDFLKSKMNFFSISRIPGLFESICEALKPEKNAIILSKLSGFDFDKIPEEFLCMLTNEIMTEPVVDNTLEDSQGNKIESAERYELESFQKWLSEHNNLSPLTRKNVPIPLQIDLKMQTEIRKFVDSEVDKNSRYVNSISYILKKQVDDALKKSMLISKEIGYMLFSLIVLAIYAYFCSIADYSINYYFRQSDADFNNICLLENKTNDSFLSKYFYNKEILDLMPFSFIVNLVFFIYKEMGDSKSQKVHQPNRFSLFTEPSLTMDTLHDNTNEFEIYWDF